MDSAGRWVGDDVAAEHRVDPDTPVVSASEFTRNCADVLDQLEMEMLPFLLTRDRRIVALVTPLDRGYRRSGRRPESLVKRRLSYGEGHFAAEPESRPDDSDLDSDLDAITLSPVQRAQLAVIAAGGGREVLVPEPQTHEGISGFGGALVRMELDGLIVGRWLRWRATPKGLRMARRNAP